MILNYWTFLLNYKIDELSNSDSKLVPILLEMFLKAASDIYNNTNETYNFDQDEV